MKPSAPKIFDQIAERIIEQIRQGVLTPGSKVPSVRHMSRQLRVNTSTVNRAYWKLENEGLLECRPQSGFYVRPKPLVMERNSPKNEPPRFTSIKKLVEKVNSLSYILSATTNPANLFLSVGFPGLAVLATKPLIKSLRIGLTKAGPKAFNYNWPSGHEPLKKQLARHYFDCGLDVAPEKIILTSGCSESLNVCYRAVTQPGDIVAVESPLSPSVLIRLQAYRIKIVEIPMDPHEGIDLDYLRRALKKYPIKACISMPNFSNPMGTLMPDENKKRLVEMLAERESVLIENDLYGDVYFGASRPKPAKAFDKTGNVLLCSSFSKVLSPGIRVGWVIPGKDVNAAIASKFSGSSATNAFTEAGIADYMERGEYARHLRKVRNLCETNLDLFIRAVARYFPEGTRTSRPQGGLLFWVEFPKEVDALQLHNEALAKNILFYPGQAFSMTNKYKNCMSIGMGHQWSDSMEKVLETLGSLAKKQMNRASN